MSTCEMQPRNLFDFIAMHSTDRGIRSGTAAAARETSPGDGAKAPDTILGGARTGAVASRGPRRLVRLRSRRGNDLAACTHNAVTQANTSAACNIAAHRLNRGAMMDEHRRIATLAIRCRRCGELLDIRDGAASCPQIPMCLPIIPLSRSEAAQLASRTRKLLGVYRPSAGRRPQMLTIGNETKTILEYGHRIREWRSRRRRSSTGTIAHADGPRIGWHAQVESRRTPRPNQ